MSISIYRPKLNEDLPDPQMFFDLNGQEYELYLNPIDTDIDIVLLNHHTDMIEYPSKIKLFLEIWHNFENQINIIKHKHKNNNNDWYTVTNSFNPDTEQQSNIIYNNFLFNRTKAYYSQFPFKHNTQRWYYENEHNFGYVIPDRITAENKNKIYIAPNKNHTGREIKFRPQIAKLLENVYYELGYIGNITDNPNLVLHPHSKFHIKSSIQVIENMKIHVPGMAGYSPPHNAYYENTFISIYAETIEWGHTIAVTEKTYDPLIKGHFILPFSNKGFVKYLKTLGFQFPNFIDYSYDEIVEDQLRFNCYVNEIHRLMLIDLDSWKQHWNDNVKLLRYNQLIFAQTPYDQIDFKKLLC
jgi:hypothetical protein